MKKKLLSFIFAICLIVPVMFCLSGCVKDENPPVTYIVQFYNYDGTLVKEISVEENTTATCEIPTKASTQYYVYEFSNWEFLDGTDATEDLESVTKTLMVRANFNEVQPTYTINFYDEDGQTLLDSKTVLRGESLTLPTDLTKESDEYFNYSFVKWEDANNQACTKITTADKNMDFYITWGAIRHTCRVDFYDTDKITILKTTKVSAGNRYNPNAEYKATKTDWTFLDWYSMDDEPYDYMNYLNEDLSIYAYYAKDEIIENGITYKIDYISDGYEQTKCYAIESTANELVSGEIDLEKTFYSLDVRVIKYKAFFNNSNLTKVKLGKISHIESGSFYNCPNIVFDTEGNSEYRWWGDDYQCLTWYDAYYDERGIVYVNAAMKSLPDEIVSINDYAFTGCDNLEEIVLGENIKVISGDTFYDCNNLKKITIGKNLTTIYGGYESIVEDMTKVEIIISDANTKYGVLEWYDTDKTTLLKREIYDKSYSTYVPAERTGYSASGWSDEEGNSYEILLENKINNIASSLVKLYVAEWIPNCTQGLISYKYSAASGGYEVVTVDKSCTEVIIPSEINGYPVTGIASNAFKDNKSLTSITIPNSVKIIRTNAFKGCTGIKNIVISSSVTTIEYEAFDYNCRFDSITIDSATIANNLITNSATNSWITDAVKVYIKTGLDVSKSTYLYEKCTKQETSDKTGYDMYVRNAE